MFCFPWKNYLQTCKHGLVQVFTHILTEVDKSGRSTREVEAWSPAFFSGLQLFAATEGNAACSACASLQIILFTCTEISVLYSAQAKTALFFPWVPYTELLCFFYHDRTPFASLCMLFHQHHHWWWTVYQQMNNEAASISSACLGALAFSEPWLLSTVKYQPKSEHPVMIFFNFYFFKALLAIPFLHNPPPRPPLKYRNVITQLNSPWHHELVFLTTGFYTCWPSSSAHSKYIEEYFMNFTGTFPSLLVL